jgi:phosphoglycerol transferase MdoB-like AlkP superfamily enzyme
MALLTENSPAHVIKSYLHQTKIERMLAGITQLPPEFTFRDDVRAAPGKNIVWVFLESFNDALVDGQQFPGLTPNLIKLSKEGFRLRSLIQVPGQQGSLAGMEAAECGRYTFRAVPDHYDVCIGHILHAAGYRQVFIAGYEPGFYKDLPDRLRSWRFDEIIAKAQFDQMPKYARNKGGWGYFDSALFDYSYLKLVELRRDEKPFRLVLFTSDTHDGIYDETLCGAAGQPYIGPGKDNKVIRAAHCADVLLSDFIRKISGNDKLAGTIIVLVGDHIMHERLIHISKNHDTVFGLILNGGVTQVHEGRSMHMDLAPTVLGLARVRTNARFLDGRNLLGSEPPARNIDLSSLPKEFMDEFGLAIAPKNAERGILYKHTTNDVYEYIRGRDMPFRERNGIRAYQMETKSFNWRNILVFLDAKDCAILEG